MAEQVVTLLVEKVGQLLINEARFMCRVRVQLEELQAELRQMRCFLKDADGRQEESETLQDLVIDIRKVTCDAEDVLELYAFKVSSRRRRRNVLLRFACIFNEGIALYMVGSKIDRIKIKFSKLTARLERSGIKAVREGGKGPSSSHERLNQVRRSYSHVIEEDVVGFDEDIKTLVEKLVNQDHRVVSIFGMGGLGKTTLAKKVYHHPDVRRHFDSFAWVCISQMWEKMDVLKGILIKLIPEQTSQIKQMMDAELVKQLHGIQQQKKCLVVLDDIWNNYVWNALQQAFPDGDAGSRILLTTRKKEVACHIDRCGFHHQLGFLNREESWQLLLKKAFPGRRDTETRVETQMEKKGKEMLERCGDVPLAIVVVGGLLVNRYTLDEWEKVHHSLDRYLKRGEGFDPQDQKSVQQVLALSYNDLPYQLKSCFLYLGNFQEDFKVSTEKLFLLWIAEGLVIPEDRENEETMMDVAKRYLGELAQRSMVQVESSNDKWWRPRTEEQKETTCRLHDLMRDLCLSKRKGEDSQSHGNVRDSSSSSTGITKTRKLAIYFGLGIDLPNLKEFKLLRVLDFEGFGFREKGIPEGIGKLIHLKYLSFRNCLNVWKLPSSIGNLQFLQILDIRGYGCISVPNVLWKLESLRHLYLPDYWSEINENLTLDGLSRLEILENFDTGTYNVLKDLFTLPELRNLKAKFKVGCTEDMETIINYLNATSHQLRCTYLRFILGFEEEEPFLVSRKVFTIRSLENLELEGKIGNLPEYRRDHFSASLTEISLLKSGLTEDPMTTLEKLPNLKSLELGHEAYVGNEMVCSAGGFPQLQILILCLLTKLENWRVDEGALPLLSSLYIYYCREMKRLPEGLKTLTKLQELEIYWMRKAFGDKVRGEDSYIIQHVPSVTFKYEGCR
ncbi:hypothetical protein LguiA_001886 [Lonicera macranthoides]